MRITIKKTNRRFTPKKWENYIKKILNGAFISGGQHWPDIVSKTGKFYECKVIKHTIPPTEDLIWAWLLQHRNTQSAQHEICAILRAFFVIHWQTVDEQWDILFCPWDISHGLLGQYFFKPDT